MKHAACLGLVLTVDVGNTTTRFGLFDQDNLLFSWRITTREPLTFDEAFLSLDLFMERYGRTHSCAYTPEDAIISSVVPPLTDVWKEALRHVCKRRPLVVGPGLKTGIKMNYHDPAEIGSDRVADFVAAKATYGSPLIVVDVGTTTNFGIIDSEGAFAGGLIAPGLRLSASSLVQAAAKLPTIEVAAPKSIIGKSTREAMQAGVIMGEVARIDGLIDMVWHELGYETTIIISGADAAELAALMSHRAHVDDSLTLRGLQRLFHMNRKNETSA